MVQVRRVRARREGRGAVTWHFIVGLLIGAVFQWLSLSFARRLGERRGHRAGFHAGWCAGFQEAKSLTISVMTRLHEAKDQNEARRIRDEMLAELELEGVKH